jgi:hypothetical protein
MLPHFEREKCYIFQNTPYLLFRPKKCGSAAAFHAQKMTQFFRTNRQVAVPA